MTVRPVPIFVLGLQRSGTTWIGNLLAAHPAVAAVTDVRHRGIHESLFFSHFARAWDWSDSAGRAAAIAAFLDSDYGRLLNLAPPVRARLFQQTCPYAAFRLAMDDLAARSGARAWVEKSPHHLHHADAIAAAFPEARFVTIRRDSAGLVASRRRAYGRRPRRGLADLAATLRGAASNAWHGVLLDRFARANPHRTVALDYEAFKAAGAKGVAALVAGLGLPPAPGLAPAFAPNSSFAGEVAAPLTLEHRAAMAVGHALARGLPDLALHRLRRARGGGAVRFPGWVWEMADAEGGEHRETRPNPGREPPTPPAAGDCPCPE